MSREQCLGCGRLVEDCNCMEMALPSLKEAVTLNQPGMCYSCCKPLDQCGCVNTKIDLAKIVSHTNVNFTVPSAEEQMTNEDDTMYQRAAERALRLSDEAMNKYSSSASAEEVQEAIRAEIQPTVEGLRELVTELENKAEKLRQLLYDVMDSRTAARAERDAWIETAKQHLRNEEFYHGIVNRIGEPFGVAARTSDDGSVQQDVLALKVPELVVKLRQEIERLTIANEAAIREAGKSKA